MCVNESLIVVALLIEDGGRVHRSQEGVLLHQSGFWEGTNSTSAIPTEVVDGSTESGGVHTVGNLTHEGV
jgi:hypothetical protein